SSGRPAKSERRTVVPSISGKEKSGAGVPSGNIVEGVRAMIDSSFAEISGDGTWLASQTPPPGPLPCKEMGSRRSSSPSPLRGGGRGEGLLDSALFYSSGCRWEDGLSSPCAFIHSAQRCGQAEHGLSLGRRPKPCPPEA